jgi:hypothetical protein
MAELERQQVGHSPLDNGSDAEIGQDGNCTEQTSDSPRSIGTAECSLQVGLQEE